MITLEDFSSIYTTGRLEKSASSWKGTATGAAGGAALGLLLQALRPKDRDQNKLKEYILSALTGAGLGAAAGFAYDNLGKNKFMPTEPSQPNSTDPNGDVVPLPDNVRLEDGYEVHTHNPSDSDEEEFYKQKILERGGGTTTEDLYRAGYGVPLADDGSIATGRFFVMHPELLEKLIEKNALFGESKGAGLREAAKYHMPVMLWKSPGGGYKVIRGYEHPESHILYPAIYKNRGVIFDDDENILVTALRSILQSAGDVTGAIGNVGSAF